MPTPAERKALLFLAGVTLLGGSVRLVRAARGDEHGDEATRAALARQLAAVDSAHGRESEARRNRGKRSGSTRTRARAAEKRDSSHRSSDPVTAPTISASVIPSIVDLDVADMAAIERLPRIGPVLAQRIVDDRTTNGAFGSIEGFQRVRGVGPALARELTGRVTFSGTARPSNAVVGAALSASPPSPKSPRRERRNRAPHQLH
jgi:competence protein ComEA